MKINLTPMEERVKSLYLKDLHISKSYQINIYKIAEHFNIWIHEANMKSKLYNRPLMPSIILNKCLGPREQWEDFGHEIGHYFLHVKIQTDMANDFRILQEEQAAEFAFDFCCPTFMLLENKEVYESPALFIYENFNVTRSFAKRKANYLRNKINRSNFDEWLTKRTTSKPSSLEPIFQKQKKYSQETLRILNQLNKQIGAVNQ